MPYTVTLTALPDVLILEPKVFGVAVGMRLDKAEVF